MSVISKGQLKGKVLRFLNKTSNVRGFYDDAKMNDALDMVFEKLNGYMGVAGQGWMTDYIYMSTVGGQVALEIPANVAFIREVRYKVGDTFYCLVYDEQIDQPSGMNTAGNQLAWRWRMMNRRIVFDPQMAEGGQHYLQLEVVYAPPVLVTDQDMLDPQFNGLMQTWMIYHISSILSGSLEKMVIAWQGLEDAAWNDMQTAVTRRLLKSVPIREGWS